MNISADGGGICLTPHKQFGNFTFSSNLFAALDLYDKENNYMVYLFPDSRLAQKFSHIQTKQLFPQRGWMKLRVSVEEMLQPKNVFLAVNQALPLYTSAKIITFCHGLSFLKFPDLYKENVALLHAQFKDYTKCSHHIIVSSERVKEEFSTYAPECLSRISVLPFGIPFAFQNYKTEQRDRFFIFSGMNHPIKHINFVIDAFKKCIQEKQFADFKLYVIGVGKELLENTQSIDNGKSSSVIVIPHASQEELLSYYRRATAYLTASHYESFNFPVLEALSQRCPVVGLPTAVIPEMQEFCQIAYTADEFVENMKKVATSIQKHSQTIDLKLLHQTFSWEQYVKTLCNIYNV